MNQVSRLAIIPHLENEIDEVERYVPLTSLVGPFTFPIEMFRRKLQLGNQTFGDFALYPSDSRERARAFNYKKLLDVLLYLFDRLSKAPRNLCGIRVLCLMKLKNGHTAQWIRDPSSCGDLAKAYNGVESFIFFIEVTKKGNDAEEDAGAFCDADFRDLDDIMQTLFEQDSGDKSDKSRKRRHDAYFANRNEVHPDSYNLDKNSLDLVEVLRTPLDVGKMLEAVLGNSGVSHLDDRKLLNALPYALSKTFNASYLYSQGSARIPYEFVDPFHPIHGECVDLCKGLTFSILSDDFAREHFCRFAFPDIRRVTTDFEMPIPDDDTMTSVTKIQLDRSVPIKGKSSFDVARERLLVSQKQMLADCDEAENKTAKRKLRSEWQTQAFVPFKALFNPDASISPSLRSMIEDWELKDEKFQGIPLETVDFTHPFNINRQCAWVKALYGMAEDAGVYCHHSMFIQMLLNARWATRKGDGRGPHMVVYGMPGSGKSYLMEMIKKCMFEGFCAGMTSMSRLAWAVKDSTNPDNPDTCQAQISILVDEVPASYLGADNSGKKGEDNDALATLKEMLTASKLTWRRNIEAKAVDGLKTRALESGQITNEPVFIGGMNRPPRDINAAFRRRISFATCVQFKRGDGVTFEDCKVKSKLIQEDENEDQGAVNNWLNAMQTNSQLHMMVSLAEYCRIIRPPSVDVWKQSMPLFKKAVLDITTVSNFDDRLEDAKNRLIMFTRTIAIFQTYQTGQQRTPTFDEIVAQLVDVEEKSVAGESLCWTMLSTLEDSCFPLMHRVVLQAVRKRWPSLETGEEDHQAYEVEGAFFGAYGKLTLRTIATIARGEDARTCAKRVLFHELRSIITNETKQYKIEGGEDLAAAAIEELMGTFVPDHPVIIARENPTDGRVEILVSLVRLRNASVSLIDVIKPLATAGTHLMMMPYKMSDNRVLPQFPMFVEGTAQRENQDDVYLKKRLEEVFAEDAAFDLWKPGLDPNRYPESYATIY